MRVKCIDNEDINTNKSYYFFCVKIKDLDGYINTYDGIVKSDNGLFPLRQTEERYRNNYGNDILIDYKSIIEISKEDYEWKHAEMSKFIGDGKGE